MRKLIPFAVLAASLTAPAHAADLRLGLNTSAALGCQIAGLRAGIQQDRVGLFGQVSYCNAVGGSGASFGVGVNVDVAHFNNLTTYVLGGLDTLPSGSVAANVGVGLRYSTPLLPVEGYLEGGVQFIRSQLLGTLPGPRLALGVNYRLSVDNLQGTIVPEPSTSASTVQYSGAAPATCNLTPEQDAAAARSAAQSAANSGLSDAAGAYSAAYSSVSYKVNVGGVSISGNSAKVSGSVTLKAVQRSNGKDVGGTFGGTINLTRDGCGWRATGYTQR